MTLILAEDFSIYRAAGTITVNQPYTLGSGIGLTIAPCPSGYGWALTRATAETAAAFVGLNTVAALYPDNAYGLAGIFTMDIVAGSAVWVDVLRQTRLATNDFGRLQYQRSTNLWRFARDLNVAVGATFSGPADVTQPFEVAMEFVRDAAAGSFKVWFDGVLATNQTGLNTGSFVAPLGIPQIAVPSNAGAGGGLTTASNWLAWLPATRPYPGKRILQRLEPVADVIAQWIPTARPHWPAMADAGWAVTAVGGTGTTIGFRNSFSMSDLTDEPLVLEALFFHCRVSAGSIVPGLIEAGGEQLAATIPANGGRASFPTSFGGVPWTAALANTAQIVLEAAAANTQATFAHLLVVRSVEAGSPPAPPAGGGGGAQIIAGRPRWRVAA